MNETLWDTTNPVEVLCYFFLGFGSFFLHGYALFLCYAISEYQDEKPCDEKCSVDVLIKGIFNRLAQVTHPDS